MDENDRKTEELIVVAILAWLGVMACWLEALL